MTAGVARWWAVGLGLVLAWALAGSLELLPPLEPTVLVGVATAVAGSGPTIAVLALGVPVSAPSMLFAVAVAVFHLGLVGPWAIGMEEAPLWLANAPVAALADALWCLVLAFAALQLGLLFGWRRFDRRPPSLAPVVRPRRTASALHSGGLAIAAVAAVLAFANLCTIGIGSFLGGAYGHEIYDTTDSRLLQTCLFWALPAGLLVAMAGARAGAESRRSLLLVAVTTCLLLSLGDRGDAVAFACAALVIRTYTHGAIPLRTAAPAAVGGLVVIALVAIVRQLPRNSVSTEDLRTAAANATPSAALAEMGWTLRPLVETIRLVPATAPYRHGQSYVDAAARLLPNLALSRADGDWVDPLTLPPNHWITFTVEPWTWAAFGGLGYSAVAEPYLNFGVGGVVAYFLLAGVLLGRLDRRLATAPPRRVLATAAVVLMPLLITARNDYQNFVRPAVWGVCLVAAIERGHGVKLARPLPAEARA